MLHPRYKTSYFKRSKWPTEWITEAVQITRDAWEARYMSQEVEEIVPPSVEGTPVRGVIFSLSYILTR